MRLVTQRFRNPMKGTSPLRNLGVRGLRRWYCLWEPRMEEEIPSRSGWFQSQDLVIFQGREWGLSRVSPSCPHPVLTE